MPIREIDEKLIRPESLMSSSDMAKLGCNNCEGCSDCCRDRAEMITLDACDVRLLKKYLKLSFYELLEKGLAVLSVADGIVLPSLGKKDSIDECIFLDEKGKCSIHEARPGICRMFPLARIYHEDGSFSYFMQPDECSRSNGVKIKISKWLGYPDIRAYEKEVREYHDALRSLRERCAAARSAEEQTGLQKLFLETWFVYYS